MDLKEISEFIKKRKLEGKLVSQIDMSNIDGNIRERDLVYFLEQDKYVKNARYYYGDNGNEDLICIIIDINYKDEDSENENYAVRIKEIFLNYNSIKEFEKKLISSGYHMNQYVIEYLYTLCKENNFKQAAIIAKKHGFR